jgi:hypothetical protein
MTQPATAPRKIEKNPLFRTGPYAWIVFCARPGHTGFCYVSSSRQAARVITSASLHCRECVDVTRAIGEAR